MKSHLLTAVIPVGEDHLAKNRIKHWVAEANKFSSELKLVIVIDSEKLPTSSQFENLNLSNFEIIQGNFGSPGSTRNAGQIEVNSKWLSFWDCDDEPNIESFLEMVKILQFSSRAFSIKLLAISLLLPKTTIFLVIIMYTIFYIKNLGKYRFK